MITTPYFRELSNQAKIYKSSYYGNGSGYNKRYLSLRGFSDCEIEKIHNSKLDEKKMIDPLKKRIIVIGLKYSKVAELLEVTTSHLCRCLNNKTLLSEEKENRLDYILTQYENIQL